MVLKLIEKDVDHLELEKNLYQTWLDKNLFEAQPEKKNEKFSLMMPPPNVTGTLHIGHALNITLQDILARYWRMNKKDVLWQPGTDHIFCNRLPVNPAVARDLHPIYRSV